jgi:2-C-methyl-D-erythritol 4-phosphate cytidylyltransferase/2-C-methyl-D-erythritol 2,4-cyclodiphosphate synthase
MRPLPYRIGQGFDVHRFDATRRLRLCGIELDGPGLAGHSDADVALHAVTDAVLGAAGCGDIGEHFPPSDPRWRDAASRMFVRFAVDAAASLGYRVSSCDLTVIGERPRIARQRAALRRSLAECLGVAAEQVNVKATTTEGLGCVGRGEGLAAMAVVLLERTADE